jgi:hypothetical protein
MTGRLSVEEIRARVAALAAVGFGDEQVRAICGRPSHEGRIGARDEMLRGLRSAFRRRVRALHPDLNQGDQGKAEELRLLVAAWQDLEQWTPPHWPNGQRPQPQQQRTGFVVVSTSGWGSATSTNATGAWGSTGFTYGWRRR